MEASDRSEDFIPAGLAALGIDADETELAVMAALHRLLWPAIGELLALDLGEIEPEPSPDLSRAPLRARHDQASISDPSRREQRGSHDE